MTERTQPPAIQGAPFRFSTLGALYVSQALPLGFFTVAIPAILRLEGLSLERLGLLSALAAPWLLKFLWAPWVDRHGRSDGHYRSWILPLQGACVLTVLWIASLDLGKHTGELLLAGGLFMLLSATQDIASDGLAVRLLRPEERGLGNGIQVGGYFLGQILGGGIALMLYGHFGWSPALGAMALVLALPMLLVWRLREPPKIEKERGKVGFGDLGRFFARPGILSWVLLLLLWRAAETMVLLMFNPMLVDRGHALEDIGLLIGVVGSLASLVGALTGGYLTQGWGRRKSLLILGGLLALSLSSYIFLGLGQGGPWAIYGAVCGSAFCAGMATASLYTSMMDRSDIPTAATDFTLQQSLAAMGPVLASAASGFSAAALGYAGHFALATGLQVGVVLFAVLTFQGMGSKGRTGALATP